MKASVLQRRRSSNVPVQIATPTGAYNSFENGGYLANFDRWLLSVSSVLCGGLKHYQQGNYENYILHTTIYYYFNAHAIDVLPGAQNAQNAQKSTQPRRTSRVELFPAISLSCLRHSKGRRQ
jgi:hypothetical protein